MLLNDARRKARFAGGEVVLLADRDRSLWDRETMAAVRAALTGSPVVELNRAVAIAGAGDPAAALRRALELVRSDAERLLLERRLAELGAPGR